MEDWGLDDRLGMLQQLGLVPAMLWLYIGVKPGVVDGHIAIREYLSLTISFNHELIDGAPAAHFTEQSHTDSGGKIFA